MLSSHRRQDALSFVVSCLVDMQCERFASRDPVLNIHVGLRVSPIGYRIMNWVTTDDACRPTQLDRVDVMNE